MNFTVSNAQLVPVSVDQDHLLHRVAHRIRRSLELQEILTTTVAEVQQFLQVDRVKIYKFHPDGSGQVIAEYLAADRALPSLYGLNFPADDIPPHSRQLFIEARVRTVTNVKSGLIGQSRLRDPETGEIISEDFAFRPLDPCHQEYLTTMGVQSSLGAPIFHQDQLWGLLIAHHSAPYDIPIGQLQGIQVVVDQLSVAIAQSTLLQQTRDKAQQEATLRQISTLLHAMPTMELQAALEATIGAFQGSGGRLFLHPRLLTTSAENSSDIAPRLYTHGTQPILHAQSPFPMMEQFQAIQTHFQTHIQTHAQSGEAPPWAIEDLYQVSELRTLQSAFRDTPIRSLLMVPLTTRQQSLGYLTLFRDEFATETLWAGRHDPDQRQDLPRQSFELWRQSQSGQTRPWLDSELRLAKDLAKQFATEIEQHDLYGQVQALNANLEGQVQARTLELEQKNQHQTTLFNVVSKVRQSLDLNTIFTTTTIEVRHALQADRVCIFRFDPDSALTQGQFVAEDVVPLFRPILGRIIQDHCFADRYGAEYAQRKVHVVPDVQNAGFSECHLDILKQVQVKSKIIISLMSGEKLWGLLSIHQCAQARHWEASEIKFVEQIAAQLSIALEQSDLLAQTTQQAQKLTEMITELQQAQAHLIQTEKMSSLGQLVAGVAHEINNPVTFIHGNIVHISDYMKALLSLVDLYQQRYGETDPDIQALIEEIDLEFLTKDLKKVISSMHMGTQRIREIVLSLRNFSRLDQSEKKPVNLHEGIDSTLLILQHRLNAVGTHAQIQVVKQYGDLPEVECYASQLNQVLMNLLANAIDALNERQQQQMVLEMEENPGVITIVTEAIGSESVKIIISDNGMGIPEFAMNKLFDPFYTTKPVGQGTGLGLAISYQIITERHQGKLQCFSTPGVGTQFVIEIPIQ